MIFDQKLITKGALPQVLSICDRVELPNGKVEPIGPYQKQIEGYFDQQSEKGLVSLAVAYGEGTEEKNLIFLGILAIFRSHQA